MGLRQGQLDRPTVDVVREILDDGGRTGSAPTVPVVGVVRRPAVTVQLAAALREMLHNIAKHAEATLVEVELTADAGVELVVRDDGVGFDPTRARRGEASGHFGLRGLHEAGGPGGRRDADRLRRGRGDHHPMDSHRQPIPAWTTEHRRTPIRVAIADDNAVVRMGIRSLLGTADDWSWSARPATGWPPSPWPGKKPTCCCSTYGCLVRTASCPRPEVTEYTSVLMLTYSDSAELISAAVQAGALGYLVHGNFSEDELLSAVRMAARGFGTFSAQAVAALSRPVATSASRAAAYGLSEREADVMELVAQGAANSAVAKTLFISEKTVKNHINHIFAKLGVTSRGHAVALWLAHH